MKVEIIQTKDISNTISSMNDIKDKIFCGDRIDTRTDFVISIKN
ncbi:MAG: hypothetical protein KatS3mg028_1228 [Bacteroidia bacterium]|nr:MAG: hypothetical protein KatS3mg028_1228 [Bacteroidia bacterium]